MYDKINGLRLRIARLERLADLNPPLGSNPNPCGAVIDRAMNQGADIDEVMYVKDVLEDLPLVQNSGVRMLKDVGGRNKKKFYSMTYPRPLTENSMDDKIKKREPFIRGFQISSHTQFRMDVRGITVRHIDLALRDFQKRGDSVRRLDSATEAEGAWQEGNDWGLNRVELDERYAEAKKIMHEAKVGGKVLTVWFVPMKRRGGRVVSIKTVFWAGESDSKINC